MTTGQLEGLGELERDAQSAAASARPAGPPPTMTMSCCSVCGCASTGEVERARWPSLDVLASTSERETDGGTRYI